MNIDYFHELTINIKYTFNVIFIISQDIKLGVNYEY
jgi:hypothetical protein